MALSINIQNELLERTEEISWLIHCQKIGDLGHRDLYPQDVIDFSDSVICKNSNGNWEYFWPAKVDSDFVSGDVKIRCKVKLNNI